MSTTPQKYPTGPAVRVFHISLIGAILAVVALLVVGGVGLLG